MARRKRTKKKWIQSLHLRKGRFTRWCRAQGFSGPTMACVRKGKKSKSRSVRGMAILAERFKKGIGRRKRR